ncbi:MAG: hypothetical protein H6725_08115 [Sandaracinaceae bacterium]|nr:hypothetical protein [Sandaracinaceae bacterium]
MPNTRQWLGQFMGLMPKRMASLSACPHSWASLGGLSTSAWLAFSRFSMVAAMNMFSSYEGKCP